MSKCISCCMCIVSLPIVLIVLALFCPIIDITSVRGQESETLDCENNLEDCTNQIFPISYHANGTVLRKCKCTDADKCQSVERIETDYKVCGNLICCKEYDKSFPVEEEACECMQKSVCDRLKAGDTQINPRIGEKSPEHNCRVYESKCCEIHHDQVATPIVGKKTEPPPTSQTCGYRAYSSKIVPRISEKTADQVMPGEFSWVVMIIRKHDDGTLEELCAGSLLNRKIILTVAHCLKDEIPKESYIIRAGEYDPKDPNSGRFQDRRMKKKKIHPEFKVSGLTNDFALILVETGFNITDQVGPICWDDEIQNLDYDKAKCVTVGWGTGFGKKNLGDLNELRKTDMSIIDNDECGKTFRTVGKLSKFFELNPSFICAKGIDNNAQLCNIDGGTPLVCALKRDPNQYAQVGLLSWDLGCEKKELPNAFAYLKHVMKWLIPEFNVFDIYE